MWKCCLNYLCDSETPYMSCINEMRQMRYAYVCHYLSDLYDF